MSKSGTPFPWLPMIALATGLVSHSYALSSLFPYVGYMVQHLGATDDKDEAGFYAGYLSSALMVGRFGFSYFWGRFADRYGRLPVLYMGLCSIALLSVAFGLSTSFYWALVCRFLLGAMNGLVAISKTMISEVCTKEHEVVGMSMITGCWSVGLVIGPGLGGVLAEPAKHYPNVFSESGLFGRFPYLLPNLVGASVALLGIPLVFFFLKETRDLHHGNDSVASFQPLPASEPSSDDPNAEEEGRVEMTPLKGSNALGDRDHLESHGIRDGAVAVGADRQISGPDGHERDSSHSTSEIALNSGGAQVQSKQEVGLRHDGRGGRGGRGELRFSGDTKSFEVDFDKGRGMGNACRRECLLPIKLLAEPKVRGVLFVYVVSSFVVIGAQETYPLWALSTVASGGLDWSTERIGQCLSMCGLGMVIFQLGVYPWAVKRISIQTSQRLGATISIPIYMMFPLLSRLHGKGWPLVAGSLALLFAANVCANMVFINISLATNNAVNPTRRGTLNGLSMTVGSLAKAAGPSTFSVIFAWSINASRPYPFDFHLVFYLLALSMIVVSVASWNLISHAQPEEAAADDKEIAERAEQGGKG